MQASLIVAHTKILFSIMMGGCLGALAYLDQASGHDLIALSTASLSILMVLNGLFLLINRGDHAASYFEWLFIIVLASYSWLAAERQGNEGLYWMYFYPLAAFFLFRLLASIILVLLYIPLALTIVFNFSEPLNQHITVLTFSSISLVALFLALVKERTNQLLEPLISTDMETGAYQEKRLVPDLSVEINRAEREGTGLLLMIFGTGNILTNTHKNARPRWLRDIAAAIAIQLRPFDACYRLEQGHFAVIMPHTTTQDAKVIAKKILQKLPKLEPNSLEVGFASLNVEDTAQSLINTAQERMEAFEIA